MLRSQTAQPQQPSGAETTPNSQGGLGDGWGDFDLDVEGGGDEATGSADVPTKVPDPQMTDAVVEELRQRVADEERRSSEAHAEVERVKAVAAEEAATFQSLINDMRQELDMHRSQTAQPQQPSGAETTPNSQGGLGDGWGDFDLDVEGGGNESKVAGDT